MEIEIVFNLVSSLSYMLALYWVWLVLRISAFFFFYKRGVDAIALLALNLYTYLIEVLTFFAIRCMTMYCNILLCQCRD